MNPRMLKRLAIALVVLVVAWAGLGLARRAGRDREGRIRLTAFDPGVADGALVVHGADSLRFVRRGAGWLVNGHMAAAGFVTAMLRGLADTAAPSELAAENASSLPQLGLDSGAAWSVTALLGSRTLASLLVGTHGESSYGAVYVRQPGSNAAYLLTDEGLAGVTDRLPSDWRDKTIAKVPPESVAVVEVRRGARSYTLTRGPGGWSLGRSAADSAAVAGLLGQYSFLQAEGFADAAQSDSARRARPNRQVTLEAKGGRPLLVLNMDSTRAGYWTWRQGDSVTYHLEAWTVDQLTPADSTLRPRPPAPAAPAARTAAAPAPARPATRRAPPPPLPPQKPER